jgi:hypothetical protein
MQNLVFPLAAVAVLYTFMRPRKAEAAPQATNPKTKEPSSAEGEPEYLHAGTAGYTRRVGELPKEAGAFASQGLSKPYGTILGPQVLSDGRTYIAVTESHFDDHTVNPKTGVKDKHWHKGVSLLVKIE